MNARLFTLATLVVSGLLAVPSPALAKRGAPACGATFLPFHEGQVLEYEWLAPEALAVDGQAPAAPRGPQAEWPINFKITVKSIKGSKTSATITLVESYRKHSRETIIKCDERGFRTSPQSFFFTGEPGGAIGMTLSNIKQGESGLPSKRDFRPGLIWDADITAKVKRDPSPGVEGTTVTDAKIEIDRRLSIGRRELVESGMGEHRAFRVSVELAGRAAVEPELDKWRELPPGIVSMWYAPGLGLVRVHNRFGHGWQLKSVTYASE